MTGIVATAPGKLVLLGEYAVLEGAPALVLAVDRRAKATLTPIAGDTWEIVSPTLGLEGALRVGRAGAIWTVAPPAELAWVATVLARFPQLQQAPACRLVLESDAFHLDEGNARIKLGLGSSAALIVASLGALHAFAGRPRPTLNEAIRIHRAIQGGRGSGIDIAASLAGGLSRFQVQPEAKSTVLCTALPFPDVPHWCCVFTGRAASTPAMLATVAAWREREPSRFAQCMREFATISASGIAAVAHHDAAAFLSRVHDYATLLGRFGRACGAEIASREHQAIGSIAADCGAVYKSCGAGGGDVGITFAMDNKRLREFSARATRAGFSIIELKAEAMGLEVTSSL